MKVGNLIKENGEFYVITEMTNGVVTEKITMGKYLSKAILVKDKGQLRTIQSILDQETDNYLAKNDIVGENK